MISAPVRPKASLEGSAVAVPETDREIWRGVQEWRQPFRASTGPGNQGTDRTPPATATKKKCKKHHKCKHKKKRHHK
jgi:hypothetical protein